ncbi:hypothetical protein F4782DRAFT_536659 [Xylaria castorea]|nr:hypothetical protein F4782DRAFT_536659 [Xylaria castorea]
MADTAALNMKTASPTVAECADLCLESFKQCLNQAAAIHSRELSLVEDQLARFSLWSSNIKVFSSGRGSLDYRIREAPDVRDAISAVLEALDYHIQGCLHILNSLGPTNHRSLATIDNRLSEALRGIANEISLLHKFLNTIRRASKETQGHGAVEAFKIEDDEGNDAEPFLLTLFTNHIRDRFPDASDIIRHRLASTMIQRRKRILYRRFRYSKYHARPRGVPFQSSTVQPQAPPAAGSTIDQPQEQGGHQVSTSATQNTARSVVITATTLSPQSFQKASTPSVVSVSKSVALSNHQELRFPPAPCGSIQRRYRKLKQKRQREHREELNSIPGESDGLAPRQLVHIIEAKYERILASEWEECLQAVPELICPFCFCALPVRDVIDEKKWSLHVKNDLDPYVCMFEECSSPDKLYKHSHEWLKHMREHSLRWRCTLKSHGELVYNTRGEYLIHMKTEHAVKLTDAQLKVLAERNGRMIGPMFKSCPLCDIEEVDGSMEHHLVGHLRFFALKSLPSYEEDMEELDESYSEQNSFTTSSPQTRSTIRNERDELMYIAARRDKSEDEPSHTLYKPSQLVPSYTEDRSREFVDDAVLQTVTSSGHRIFEWAFDPNISGFEIESYDPVALAFRRYRKARKNLIPVPDCAICHAPATHACDCEAKDLEAAVHRAEHRKMGPMYSEIRRWAREHAEKFATGPLAKSIRQPRGAEALQPQDREKATGSSEVDLSQQEQCGASETSLEQYSEALEYFFGLTELALPAEEDPAVKDPQPSSISCQLTEAEGGSDEVGDKAASTIH